MQRFWAEKDDARGQSAKTVISQGENLEFQTTPSQSNMFNFNITYKIHSNVV